MKNKLLCAGAVALAAFSCIGANAADSDGGSYLHHGYIAVLPGYFYADKGHHASRNGFTMSGILGYQFARHWSGELNVFGTDINTGPNSLSDFYQEGLTLDLAYNLYDRDHFTPFIIAGVGGVYDDVVPNRDDSVSPMANAGVGFVTGPLFKNSFFNGIRLRAEVRYLYDRFSFKGDKRHHQDDARASIGIELPLGESAPPPPPPPKTIVKVVHVPAPPPKDSDGDGVPDNLDNCPHTLPGTRVDSHGCAIANQTVELHGVHFAFNKATLRPDAKTILNQAVAAMKGQPTMKAEIDGYTDSTGPASYNMKLSRRRAESVRQYLINQGIAADRLTSKGFGETHLLVSPERTPDDYALNRRVEFHIIAK